jgi:hypothetical protein
MADRDELWERRERATTAWQRYVDTPDAALPVRSEVLASWKRSATHLSVDRDAAPIDDVDATAEQWRASPLYQPVMQLLPELSQMVDDEFVVAITDPRGKILFSMAGESMQRHAEDVNFVPGGHWDESSVGTNALDLALRTGQPQQVFSAEHFAVAVHDWVCYSAPVLDPATGRPLGVLDVSSTWEHAHPLALTAATSLARDLQQQLDATSPGTLVLRTLGPPRVGLDGQEIHLSPRQLELVTVLSLNPDGLGLEQLHAALYPEGAATTSTCKAEVSHVRRQLGDVVGSRPYRLVGRIAADHLEVERLLEAGLVGSAVGNYVGPLLPGSGSPAIVEHRNYLHVALRQAVLGTGDPDLLVTFGRIDTDDREIHERALALLEAGDPRRALVEGRLDAC